MTVAIIDTGLIDSNYLVTGTGHCVAGAQYWRLFWLTPNQSGAVAPMLLAGGYGSSASWSFAHPDPANWDSTMFNLQFMNLPAYADPNDPMRIWDLWGNPMYWVDATAAFLPTPPDPACVVDSTNMAGMAVSGTGHSNIATDIGWRVVRIVDDAVMDTGSGLSASFAFTAIGYDYYLLQFQAAGGSWERGISFFPMPAGSPPALPAPPVPATGRYLERFANQELFHEIANAMFVHCAIVGSGNTVSGLPFPNGTMLRVIGDGVDEYNGPCEGGYITVPFTATVLLAGLPYKTIVEPNNPAAGSNQGSVRGKKQKINQVLLAFYETLGCQVGLDQDHMQTIPVMAAATQSGVPHFETGILLNDDLIIDFDGEWDDQATISIVSDNGMPFTLLAVIPVLNVSEPSS
jgi:hypothetical protein